MEVGIRTKIRIKGRVYGWLIDSRTGLVKAHWEEDNIITDVGDQLYASRGIGLTSSALPTGMKLGTGTTAATKNGAGAALATYLADSNQAIDGGFPTAVGGLVTWQATWAAGKATTGSAIREVAIVTETISSDTTSTEAETIARSNIGAAVVPSKGALDILKVIWTHDLVGQ